MTALQIVKGPPTLEPTPASDHDVTPSLDLLIDGVNVTARVPDADAVPLLRDLVRATVDLASLRSRKKAVRCYSAEGPWELGLERAGDRVLLSLFRGGAFPEVAIFERAVDLATFIDTLLASLDRFAGRQPNDALSVELESMGAELASISPRAVADPPCAMLLEVEPESDAGIRISCDFALRERVAESSRETTVERADLFSLLARGTLRIGVGDRIRSFPETFVFLFAEQLVLLAHQTLDAWEKGRAFYRRIQVMGVVLGIRLTSSRGANDEPDRESGLWLSVGGPRPGASDARTFRLGEGAAFAEATLAFSRALARSLLRHDPAQRQNLRLTAFRSALRSLDERLSEAKCDDVLVNPLPEIYRVGTGPRATPTDDRVASKLRFSPAWTTSFTGIDLRATFLCGEHLIQGAPRGPAWSERGTGHGPLRRATTP